MDTPEKMSTLRTQDTGRRQQNKNTETKKMSNTDPTKRRG